MIFLSYSDFYVLAVSVVPNNTQRHTLGRNPLDEISGRRKYLYLITHNNHKRQTSMPPTGFEPAITANERPQNPRGHWDRRKSIYNAQYC
jgi:hypothetical protein